VSGFFSTSISHSKTPLKHTSLTSSYILSHLSKNPRGTAATLFAYSSSNINGLGFPKNRSDKTSKHPSASYCTTTLQDSAQTRAKVGPILCYRANPDQLVSCRTNHSYLLAFFTKSLGMRNERECLC